MCSCSLLSNLRELTLQNVTVSLPALQPVATRLRELDLFESCLQGSADGFLTRGWTALIALSLRTAQMEDATLTAALELPALEKLDITGFRHQGGVLQLDQLTGSCPNITGLRLQLDSNSGRATQGSGPCCTLLQLGRLADLHIKTEAIHPNVDLELPSSLTVFMVEGPEARNGLVDFSWVLKEAISCIRRGAQLRRLLCCQPEAYLQPMQWGLDLDQQYRRLGGQLSSLQELGLWGGTERLLSALGAVVSSAPHLTSVKIIVTERLPRLEFSPMCSASLQNITVTLVHPANSAPPPPVVLTFLAGCTRLQHVFVQHSGVLTEGTAVKIRCHPCLPQCIVPM